VTWPTTPVRFVLTEVDERGLRDGEDGELLSVSISRGVVPRRESGSSQAASEDTSHYKRCEPGQVALNRLRAFQGGIGVSDRLGLVSPDYAVFDIAPSMDPRFVHYQVRSAWFVAEMTKKLRGIGDPDTPNVRTPRLNASDLGRIHMFTPSLKAQRSVAELLDTETSRIDAIIDKNERVVDAVGLRLRSARAQLIEETDAEWVPLRFAADEVTDTCSAPLMETLTLDRVEKATGRVQPYVGDDEAGKAPTDGKSFESGDVLFSKLRPYLAKAVWADNPGVANSEFLVFRPRGRLDPRFLYNVFLSDPFVSWATALSYGTKMPRTNSRALGRYRVPVPCRETQNRVVADMSEVEARADALVTAVREQTALLEKRRLSLINAASTGQLDI